ncbi:MAG: sel1 repeat family protein [Parachlamydia sp.]|nr:sel1 repeat family protein [Parachlamydia sp.]
MKRVLSSNNFTFLQKKIMKVVFNKGSFMGGVAGLGNGEGLGQMVRGTLAFGVAAVAGIGAGVHWLVKDKLEHDKGVQFLNGRRYQEAYTCFKYACERCSYSGRYHHNLGLVFEYIPPEQSNQTVYRDLFRAAKFYIISFENGYELGRSAFNRILQIADISHASLNHLGVLFHYGYQASDAGYGIKQNRPEALRLYQLARDRGSAIALNNMGLLYELDRNFLEAARHHQQAIERGYLWAKRHLNNLLNRSDIDSVTCLHIGVMYCDGTGVTRDRVEALKWFQKAHLQGDAGGYSEYNIGLFHENGWGGIPGDFLEAAMCYQRAQVKGCPLAAEALASLQQRANQGTRAYIQAPENLTALAASPHITRKRLKKNFTEVVHSHFRTHPGNFIDVRDPHNFTVLHHAARVGTGPLFKVCARLCFLGADILSLPPGFNTRKLQALQGGVLALTNELHSNTTPVEVIVQRMFGHNGVINHVIMRAALQELYQMSCIQPLMDLAKLACLGLHDIAAAQRDRFSMPNYESDNDDQPRRENMDECRFKIMVDPTSPDLRNMTYVARNAFGAYTHNSNQIYVGCMRDAHLVRGTFCHELCHFITYEVFRNRCNPYFAADVHNQNLFTQICNELLAKRNSLPEVFRNVFSGYQPAEYHAELIVRVAQFLVVNPSDGRAQLQQHTPYLLEYYENTFIPAIREHIKKIEKRALGGWPKEMLEVRIRTRYAFQK